jgi:hypothetical protein
VENTEIAEDEVKLVVEGAYDIAGEASVVRRACIQVFASCDKRHTTFALRSEVCFVASVFFCWYPQ